MPSFAVQKAIGSARSTMDLLVGRSLCIQCGGYRALPITRVSTVTFKATLKPTFPVFYKYYDNHYTLL